jgi:hypothetical protein
LRVSFEPAFVIALVIFEFVGCHVDAQINDILQSQTALAQKGVIAESVSNRTLSGIEEGGARISQRPKFLLERLGWPDVVAIEADMLPAERGNVGEQLIGQRFGLGPKLGNGVADGVPEDDGGVRPEAR